MKLLNPCLLFNGVGKRKQDYTNEMCIPFLFLGLLEIDSHQWKIMSFFYPLGCAYKS